MIRGMGELSLKIIRLLKRIERYRVERSQYEDSRRVDPEAARLYNLYSKKVSDAKRRLKRYIEEL